MFQLYHNKTPIGNPHPHRITCIIEAIERKLVFWSGRIGHRFLENVFINQE